MELLCRAAAMDATGTLTTTEVSPEQRVANTTADAIVQPPFVWVAHKSSADSLPPSVIVVQAGRALSPWELDVGEATPLHSPSSPASPASPASHRTASQKPTQMSNLCDTLATIAEAQQLATVGYLQPNPCPPHCTSKKTYEPISQEEACELWRIEEQWRYELQLPSLAAGKRRWVQPYLGRMYKTQPCRVNRMPAATPPRFWQDATLAPLVEERNAVPLSNVKLPPTPHGDTDAASDAGSSVSYFTDRWLPRDLQL